MNTYKTLQNLKIPPKRQTGLRITNFEITNSRNLRIGYAFSKAYFPQRAGQRPLHKQKQRSLGCAHRPANRGSLPSCFWGASFKFFKVLCFCSCFPVPEPAKQAGDVFKCIGDVFCIEFAYMETGKII